MIEVKKILLIQISLIIFSVIILYIIFKNLKSYEYEKKFADFSLISNKDLDISFFERLYIFFWQIIHNMSKLLKYSKVIEKHSKKYELDSSFNNRNFKDPLDYISLKILVGAFLDILYLITAILKYLKFSFINILIIFIVGYLFPNIIIYYHRKKRQERIEEDLLNAIIIMNNSFKSGRNILQAIKTVENELTGPIASEFEKISLDISYGLSLDVVFNRFYSRVKIEDAKYISNALTLLNETGGNIVKVFSMIERSFFDKKNLKNELNSLITSSIFVFRVLIFLPLIFILVINVLNRDYFKPLYSSIFGFIILLIIISLYILYILIIRKVLKVKM